MRVTISRIVNPDQSTRTRIAFVGGFLAAGKTTAIASAAKALVARGKRVAAIVNDEGSGLVDSATLRESGTTVAEVAGGCFGCRFSDLVDVADSLLADGPDVLFCEAVGSCTDLVATVAEPLADFYGDAVEIAPVSVVVDPSQFVACSNDDIGYVYGQQLDEADVVVVNKLDLASAHARKAVSRVCEGRKCVDMVATRGEGIEAWLGLLGGSPACGHPLRKLDYERYARGEAMLAWLNATATISIAHDCRAVAERLIARLATMDVTHVKLTVGNVRAHATAAATPMLFDTAAPSSPAESRIVINARVRGDAKKLHDVVRDALHVVHAHVDALQAFHPAYPHPENPNPYLSVRA